MFLLGCVCLKIEKCADNMIDNQGKSQAKKFGFLRLLFLVIFEVLLLWVRRLKDDRETEFDEQSYSLGFAYSGCRFYKISVLLLDILPLSFPSLRFGRIFATADASPILFAPDQ